MARKAARSQTVESADDDRDYEPEGGAEAVNKSAAVRAALDAGIASPPEGVRFIKDRFGIEVTKGYFSAIKSQTKRKGGRVPEARRGRRTQASRSIEGILSPPKGRSAEGKVDVLAALEALKPLVASLGADKVKRIVDLIG